MSVMEDLAKRVFDLGQADAAEVAVVEDLWQRFVGEYEVDDGTVPVRVADYFRGWLTERDRWGEVPSGLKGDEEQEAAGGRPETGDPRIDRLNARRADLLRQAAASHRDWLVCTVILRTLTAALDTSLRCGDPRDAGVEAFHRATPVKLAG